MNLGKLGTIEIEQEGRIPLRAGDGSERQEGGDRHQQENSRQADPIHRGDSTAPLCFSTNH